MALAISRALGDFCLKACGAAGAPLVLAEPEVTHEGLSLASGSGSGRPTSSVLVLASDGLCVVQAARDIACNTYRATTQQQDAMKHGQSAAR
jgi:hypothetical protein